MSQALRTASAATPIPTQIVSNGEYLPPTQSEMQKRVERRIFELADENGKKLGLSRRQFMATGCGMAAAFLAMKEIYGTNVFQVDAAEAHHTGPNPGESAEPRRAVRLRRADALRPRRFRPQGTPRPERLRGRALEPEDQGRPAPGFARFKFLNYVKEIYYDSDTQLALLSGAPFDDPTWWLLSNEQIARRGTWSMISRDQGACSPTP